MSRRHHGGFTVVELLALIAAGTVGAAGLAVMSDDPPAGADKPDASTSTLAALSKARAQARQRRDANQIRGITQSFVIWANNNKGVYPLPSKVDLENKTIATEGRGKDATNHIFSMLIFNGFISPELCYSPAEVNKRITIYNEYEFTNPKTAANPAEALWDPAFRCDFLRQPGGNVSYAHLQPSDSRLSMWSDTFNASEAVLGNRGPAIAESSTDDAGHTSVKLRKDKSKTFRIHGLQSSWEGNIAYNDGHVNFETRYAPDSMTYSAATGEKVKGEDGKEVAAQKAKPDNLFFDEKDAIEGKNIYLGIWRKAGDKPGEFGGIWD